MTFYTIIGLIETFQVDLETLLTVTENDTEVLGTSAMLIPKDTLTVE